MPVFRVQIDELVADIQLIRVTVFNDDFLFNFLACIIIGILITHKNVKLEWLLLFVYFFINICFGQNNLLD